MSLISSGSFARVLFTFSLALPMVGCGEKLPDNLPPLVKSSVKVMHSGQPVDGAKVLLAPKSGSFSAAGVTDSSGVAVLKTDGIYDGVAAGEYNVSITKMEIIELNIGSVPTDPKEYAAYEAKLKAQPKPKNLLPPKYASFTKSGLTASISTASSEPTVYELE